MKELLQEKLLLINPVVLGISFMNIEDGLRIVLLLLTITLSAIKIYEKFKGNADTDTKK